MSGKAGGIAGIVLGVGLAVVGIFFPPAGWGAWYVISVSLASASLVAGGAFALTFSNKVQSQEGAKAQALDITLAQEGPPVTVCFGRNRFSGMFMNYLKSSFYSKEVYSTGGGEGGKGGGGSAPPPAVVGYEYYLTYEVGLCMGPIDAVQMVWESPGDKKVMVDPDDGEDLPPLTFSGTDYAEVELYEENSGGTLRVYKGSSNQSRISSGDPYAYTGMNYRNVCWALFGVTTGFKMGFQPQPRTYSFVIDRLPKVVRDNGVTIPGFQTRGSADTEHPCYYDANPAAVIYECYTNKLWGRRMSSEDIDEASFIAAAQWLYDRNIGMSFAITKFEKIGELIDGIRSQFNLAIVRSGTQIVLRNLNDTAQTHAAIETLRADEVLEPNVLRPLWKATVNEIRAEFVNREKNFRPDVIEVKDDAGIEAAGGKVITKTIQLNGITNWNTARRQALRILSGESYPRAQLYFKMNRYKSQLQAGDVFRFIWSDWTGTTVTAYFQCMLRRAPDPNKDEIEITAQEDLLLSIVEAEETSVTFPTSYPWEHVQDVPYEEVALFLDESTFDPVVLYPRAYEPPIVATLGKEARIVFLGEKGDPGLQSIQHEIRQITAHNVTSWKQPASTTKTFNLGNADTFCITGELITNFNDLRYWNRSSTGFEFSITNPTLWENVIISVAVVDGYTDDLSALLNSKSNYMVIDDEIIQIGKVDKLGTNHYRARNIIRGRFGTKIVRHSATTRVYFRQTFPWGVKVTSDVPENVDTDGRAFPKSTKGIKTVGDWFGFDAATGGNYIARSLRPLSPRPVQYLKQPDYTEDVIRVRPRFYREGAGVIPFYEAMKKAPATLDGLGLAIQFLTPAKVPINIYKPTGNWRPGFMYTYGPMPPTNLSANWITYVPVSMSSTDDGYIEFVLRYINQAGINVYWTSNPAVIGYIRVWQVLAGRLSEDYAEFKTY